MAPKNGGRSHHPGPFHHSSPLHPHPLHMRHIGGGGRPTGWIYRLVAPWPHAPTSGPRRRSNDRWCVRRSSSTSTSTLVSNVLQPRSRPLMAGFAIWRPSLDVWWRRPGTQWGRRVTLVRSELPVRPAARCPGPPVVPPPSIRVLCKWVSAAWVQHPRMCDPVVVARLGALGESPAWWWLGE